MDSPLPRPQTAELLDLQPHPEGGWYRETWRAGPESVPEGYPGPRAAATVIYFLLPPGEESSWHRVRSDEIWLWHSGGPLILRDGGSGATPAAGLESMPAGGADSKGATDGTGTSGRTETAGRTGTSGRTETMVVTLGPELGAGQVPQHVIPGGHWQSASPAGGEEVLVSCVVAPGFDFADFTLIRELMLMKHSITRLIPFYRPVLERLAGSCRAV
jgi:predicted cupin superfamily sugar epimerase